MDIRPQSVLVANFSLVAPLSSIPGEDDHFRAMPGSLPVPPQTIRSSRSPPPGISFAEKFQARREREEIAQKLFRAVSLNKVAEVKELVGKGADLMFLARAWGVMCCQFTLLQKENSAKSCSC